MIEIIVDECVGCKKCVPACAYNAIKVVDNLAEIDLDKCTLCGACVPACPFDAIFIRKSDNQIMDLDSYRGVMTFAEQKDGKIQQITYEMLGAGRRLADDLKTELSTVICGSQLDNTILNELIYHGADRVFVIDDPMLKNFLDEPYTQALVETIKKNKPEIVLCGATALGRSFIPRVAVELKTGLTADCTELAIDKVKRELLQTRPAFGGNIMATIRTSRHRPQLATVRHKVMDPITRDETRTGEIVHENIEFDKLEILSEFIKFVKDESQKIKITDADIIVSGGRGLKAPENFELLRKLAAKLGAAIGASRASVDAGWIEYSHQVGQTGKTVKPKIYIACGISGAIQHLVGMQSSDFIIAINKDPEAPIFKVADFGIVGDLFQVIPALIKKLR